MSTVVNDTGPTLVGPSAAMADVRRQVATMAGTTAALVCGERGSGKMAVARALHAAGRHGPVTEIDCAEAVAVEPCGGGTLLLREVSALSATAQAAVLALPADVAVFATTTYDLLPLVADGAFDVELARRLSAITVVVPPLRDRSEDVEDLCRHFAAVAARRERRPTFDPDAAAVALLRGHLWPRNVRELRNFVDRAYTVAGPEGNPLRAELIEPWLRVAAVDVSPDPVAATVVALAGQPLAEVEKRLILSTLQQFRGHRIKTAASLGIGVRTLGIKLKRWRDEGEPVVGPAGARAAD